MQKKFVPVWIKYFIFSSCLILAVVLILTISFVSKFMFVENATVKRGLQNTVFIAKMNVDNFFETLSDKTVGVSIARILDEAYQNYDKYELEAYIRKLYTEIYVSSAELDAVCYLGENGQMFTIGENLGGINKRFEIMNECQKEAESKNRHRIFKHGTIDGIGNSIIMYADVIHIDNSYMQHRRGRVLLFINAQKAYGKCIAISRNGEVITVSDDDGNIVMSNDELMLGKCFDDESTNERIAYSENIYSEKLGLELSCYVPKNSVGSRTAEILTYMLLVVLISTIVIIAFALCISKRMGRPIEEILEYVKITGTGELQIDSKYSDNSEIGEIISQLERIADEIRYKTDKNEKMRKDLLETRLASYESQLNPHFINNTLQLIQIMGICGDTDGVAVSTECLGKILRYNMASENEVELSVEFENIKNYCKILKYRFEDRFTYSILVSDEIYKYVSLKFLLQPFFENSIKHGFENKKGKMEIDVFAREMNNEIAFVVKDNGVGISTERLNEIKHNLKTRTRNSEKEIGILNVHERIQLMYGEKYGVDLFSDETGTQVLIHIPKKIKSEEEIM